METLFIAVAIFVFGVIIGVCLMGFIGSLNDKEVER